MFLSSYLLAWVGWFCIIASVGLTVGAMFAQSFGMFGASVFPFILGCVCLTIDDIRKGARQ